MYVLLQRVVCCSHQSDLLGYVSGTKQNVVFVLWFERCSNFIEVIRDSERAVRKMESSFRIRNGFSVNLGTLNIFLEQRPKQFL